LIIRLCEELSKEGLDAGAEAITAHRTKDTMPPLRCLVRAGVDVQLFPSAYRPNVEAIRFPAPARWKPSVELRDHSERQCVLVPVRTDDGGNGGAVRLAE
jgi:hypothetical protein